jgi:pimeloyl-ACP methyl ester carboxylesterase
MEKSRQAEVIVDVARRQQRLERRLYGLITVALAFCVLGLWNYVRLPEYGYGDYAESTSHVVTSPDNEKFTNWELIEPSEELNWVPCFRGDFVEEFYCSRLTVPLDYNRPLHASKSNPKVHIALVMLPGRNHTETGTWSESPMLINPGGPGGEGTRLLLGRGKALQTIAGTDRDVIGFDPRGIGATTPHADCFAKDGKGDAGSLLRRDLWQMGSLAVGLANTSSTATETMVLRGRGLTKLCSTQDEENSILRYAGTPNVAQDMLSIVEAWDRWSSKESSGSLQVKSSVELRRRDGQPSGLSTKGKLVYWGFSYGTVLGATFATMFPDKVGRMVLDGVADSDQWFLENVSRSLLVPILRPSLIDPDIVVLDWFLGGCR